MSKTTKTVKISDLTKEIEKTDMASISYEDDKKVFIESIFMGCPLYPIPMEKDSNGDYCVCDVAFRSSLEEREVSPKAICRVVLDFLNNMISTKLPNEIEEKFFRDLSSEKQKQFLDYELTFDYYDFVS